MTHPGFPVATMQQKASVVLQRLIDSTKTLPPPSSVATSGELDLTTTGFVVLDASGGVVAATLPDPGTVADARRRAVLVARAPGGGANDATINGTIVPDGGAQTWVSDDVRWYRVA
jgi:hypothetical protein